MKINSSFIPSENYSTTEKKVGTWFNGDTIYRKVFSLNNWPNNGTTQLSHGITNLKKVIKIEYTWYDTDDKRWFYGLRNDATDIYIKVGSVSSTTIYCLGRGTDWSRRTTDVNIVMEYTKNS